MPKAPQQQSNATRKIAIAWTGASGTILGLRLLECLLKSEQEDIAVWLMISQAARLVAKQELDLSIPAQPRAVERLLAERLQLTPAQVSRLTVFASLDWNAPPASGSNPPQALVICPCSMGTLAKLAAGLADDLIARAADVVIKERRQLILVPRETPFSVIHLENMLKLAQAGAVILPPIPGFYHLPQDVMGLVDYVVARLLDHLQIQHQLLPRWGCSAEAADKE